jgi:hypothetical protein
MSDREANDVSGYGICFECKEPAPNGELRAVPVVSDKHTRNLPADAWVCGECDPGRGHYFDLEDKQDPDHVPATCGIPATSWGTALQTYQVATNRFAYTRSLYKAKVIVASQFLRGKEVPRG